ncbi:MAG: MOSC domain-containing protein [Actinomycetota bacterium]
MTEAATEPMPEPVTEAKLLAVSVGRPRTIDRNGQEATTAIWKAPVDGPVLAAGVNLAGDDQADRSVHGGYDKAIYSYADEDRRWWEAELGQPVELGGFGENLTTVGIDLGRARIGERWRVGAALLEVSEPRIPCWKLNRRMDDRRFIQRFTAAGRPGSYLRIVEEGELQAGDPITVVHVPDHDLTIGEVAETYRERDRAGAERMLAVEAVSEGWKGWARELLERS